MKNIRGIVNTLISCSKLYKENLLNKNLLFIVSDKHSRVGEFEVSFFDRNFLHLTGVRYKGSASRFFYSCLERKLSERDLIIPDNGTTKLKLEVLPSLLNKNLSANMTGAFNGNRVNLYTEKLVGGTKACVGFLIDEESGVYVPNTILKEDIRKNVSPCQQILATFRKNFNDEIYEELVHKSKNAKWEKMKFSKNAWYKEIVLRE